VCSIVKGSYVDSASTRGGTRRSLVIASGRRMFPSREPRQPRRSGISSNTPSSEDARYASHLDRGPIITGHGFCFMREMRRAMAIWLPSRAEPDQSGSRARGHQSRAAGNAPPPPQLGPSKPRVAVRTAQVGSKDRLSLRARWGSESGRCRGCDSWPRAVAVIAVVRQRARLVPDLFVSMQRRRRGMTEDHRDIHL